MALLLSTEAALAAVVQRRRDQLPQVQAVAAQPLSERMQASLERLGKAVDAGGRACSHVLAPGEYQLLSIDALNVPQEELKAAVRWRLQDMLDFHVDDATVDVLAVPANDEAQARAAGMFAVVAHNQLIKQRQALFEEAGLGLSVIDIPEMAQRNIAALLEPPERGLALLSFDEVGGLLTLTFAGELYLSRRLDISLPQLKQGDPAQQGALHERITLEVQRSLDHFDRQYRQIALSKLVLAPLGFDAHALHDSLTANLYLPVETLELEGVFDLSQAPLLREPVEQQRYFLVLGAALRQEEVLP